MMTETNETPMSAAVPEETAAAVPDETVTASTEPAGEPATSAPERHARTEGED